jgi:hypothetical protein
LPHLHRSLAVLALLLACGGLSACGKHHDEDAPIQRIENEGFYLSLGELKYQVQLSRQLNPQDIQDRSYLLGVPQDEQQLKANEVWFGVFMQVENEAKEPLAPSADIEIIDTQEDVYKPLALEDDNLFAYRAQPIPAGKRLPLPDTPAFDTPIQGAMLLFKLDLQALDNRPLELKIEAATPRQTGIIDLDV